jgi:hypothetical protein
MINKVERIFNVDNLARKDMLEQMERDTEFLRTQRLIDYSVFLLQILRPTPGGF